MIRSAGLGVLLGACLALGCGDTKKDEPKKESAGDKAERKANEVGDKVESKTDKAADRIEDRADRAAERIDDRGSRPWMLASEHHQYSLSGAAFVGWPVV